MIGRTVEEGVTDDDDAGRAVDDEGWFRERLSVLTGGGGRGGAAACILAKPSGRGNGLEDEDGVVRAERRSLSSC